MTFDVELRRIKRYICPPLLKFQCRFLIFCVSILRFQNEKLIPISYTIYKYIYRYTYIKYQIHTIHLNHYNYQAINTRFSVVLTYNHLTVTTKL